MFKASLPAALNFIFTTVNNSIYLSSFTFWKTAEVVPVPKSRDSDVPCNSQPIFLLPILSKMTERLVHGQLLEYLTANWKLAKTQSGNLKFHSTETTLLFVMEIVESYG